MSEYRINVRFKLSDTEHTAIIDHLNSLDKEKYKSRNQFIIDAIKSAIAYADKQTADDELLNKFREILKEELTNISVVTSVTPSSVGIDMELTEEQKLKNDAEALAFLDMFWRCQNIRIFGATEENEIKNGTAYGANRLDVIFMTEDEKKLIQAKHRLEQAENRNRKKERTERNHRLIVEGAISEKLLPEIKTMNLTEIEGYLRGKLN